MQAMPPTLVIALLLWLFGETAQAQQPDPYGARRGDSPGSSAPEVSDSGRPLSGGVDERLKTVDSVVYRLASSSRLQVKTGKAGLFGFAGHTHVVQARGFQGKIVYYPGHPSSSHLDITVLTDRLEVLTPPDT